MWIGNRKIIHSTNANRHNGWSRIHSTIIDNVAEGVAAIEIEAGCVHQVGNSATQEARSRRVDQTISQRVTISVRPGENNIYSCIFRRGNAYWVGNRRGIDIRCPLEDQLYPVYRSGRSARVVTYEYRPNTQGTFPIESIKASIGAWTNRTIIVWWTYSIIIPIVDSTGWGIIHQEIIIIVTVWGDINDGGRGCISWWFKRHLNLSPGGMTDVQAEVDIRNQ